MWRVRKHSSPRRVHRKIVPHYAISSLGIVYRHLRNSRQSLMCDLWLQVVCNIEQGGIAANSFKIQNSIHESIIQHYQLLIIRQEPSLLLTMTSSLLGNAIHIITKFHFTDG